MKNKNLSVAQELQGEENKMIEEVKNMNVEDFGLGKNYLQILKSLGINNLGELYEKRYELLTDERVIKRKYRKRYEIILEVALGAKSTDDVFSRILPAEIRKMQEEVRSLKYEIERLERKKVEIENIIKSIDPEDEIIEEYLKKGREALGYAQKRFFDYEESLEQLFTCALTRLEIAKMLPKESDHEKLKEAFTHLFAALMANGDEDKFMIEKTLTHKEFAEIMTDIYKIEFNEDHLKYTKYEITR